MTDHHPHRRGDGPGGDEETTSEPMGGGPGGPGATAPEAPDGGPGPAGDVAGEAGGEAAGVAPTPPRRAGRGRRATLAALGALVVALVVAAVPAVRRPPPDPEGTVVLYGDSLSVEAREAFSAELAGTSRAQVTVAAVPGASPCDALPAMRAAATAAEPPDVVILQYVGNNASPCARGPDGATLTGQALADRTEADVRAAVDLFAAAGSRVVLVGGPDSPGLPGQASLLVADAFNEIVDEWAGRDLGRVRYADAAATVTGPDHRFVPRLPCRPVEGPDQGCRHGEVTVRGGDAIHFCPSGEHDDQVRCTVPSPGAARFGAEMARVARLALDPAY